jgi:hypothetical protein
MSINLLEDKKPIAADDELKRMLSDLRFVGADVEMRGRKGDREEKETFYFFVAWAAAA